MKPTQHEIRTVANKLTKSLADAGKIIEGGWAGFALAVLPAEASQIQRAEMRKAFFAGSAHLFASMMNILDPGSEPTQRDLDRMTLISDELEAFQKEFELQYGRPDGSA